MLSFLPPNFAIYEKYWTSFLTSPDWGFLDFPYVSRPFTLFHVIAKVMTRNSYFYARGVFSILADPASLLVAIKENIGSFTVDEKWAEMLKERDTEKELSNRY